MKRNKKNLSFDKAIYINQSVMECKIINEQKVKKRKVISNLLVHLLKREIFFCSDCFLVSASSFFNLTKTIKYKSVNWIL